MSAEETQRLKYFYHSGVMVSGLAPHAQARGSYIKPDKKLCVERERDIVLLLTVYVRKRENKDSLLLKPSE